MDLTTRTDSDLTAERFTFGVYDEKGREIGAKAMTSTATFTSSTVSWGSTHAPGVKFAGVVQMTRDGASFGAT